MLAGGRLIVAGSNGVLINIDPGERRLQSQTSTGAGVSAQPVVAGSTLYILDDRRAADSLPLGWPQTLLLASPR